MHRDRVLAALPQGDKISTSCGFSVFRHPSFNLSRAAVGASVGNADWLESCLPAGRADTATTNWRCNPPTPREFHPVRHLRRRRLILPTLVAARGESFQVLSNAQTGLFSCTP